MKQSELFKPVKQRVKYKLTKTYGTGNMALVPIFPELFNPQELMKVHIYTDKINEERK